MSAQTPVNYRLTVRPRELVGARTARAGWQDSNQTYVPPQCVGTRRCPLLVYSNTPTETLIPMADKYGLVLFVGSVSGYNDQEPRLLDDQLKGLLGRYAIDPDKIAVMGHCATGGAALAVGIANPEVFSRVVAISAPGLVPIARRAAPVASARGKPLGKTEFFFMDGIDESEAGLEAAQQLRQWGYRVKMTLAIRDHNYAEEDGEAIGRWLIESWTSPDPATRTTPDTLPEAVLTPEAITKLTAFWTELGKLRTDLGHDRLIVTAKHRAHLREVAVPVGHQATGQEYVDALMTDFGALSHGMEGGNTVTRLLRQAGLTAREHEAYRVAYLSARYTKNHPDWAATVAAASVLGRNMAFLDTAADELTQLAETIIWRLP